jgi:glycine/D-amino acid oxidase-like deaminating enzyme
MSPPSKEPEMTDYRSRSLWLDGVPGELTPRPSLPGPADVDVAIAGAGLTGLWTAYYLKKADPHLRVAVFEKEIAGFGASGRNGGWCSSLFAGSRSRTSKWYGRQAAIDMQNAMFATVEECERVVNEEGIAAGFHRGGELDLANSPVQLLRLKEELDYQRSWGFGEEHYRLLGAAEARERVRVAGCLGAMELPDCASVDPARLTRGLADVVDKLGVPIYERTPVLRIEPHRLETAFGDVKADVVVRALEGYTPSIPGYERHVIPLYSLMIATEPLAKEKWDELGWSGRETFGDGRFLIIYAMRTEDDRIAIGGRGAPYHWGSRVDEANERVPRVFEALRGVVHQLFPQLGPFAVTHTWGGPLAAPRDWYTSMGLDRTNGLAWAGGYVGDGVSTTNLSGRVLTDLILERDSELLRLPCVNHHSKQWEPEPFRYLGINLATWAMGSADHAEARTGRPSKRASLVKQLIGA